MVMDRVMSTAGRYVLLALTAFLALQAARQGIASYYFKQNLPPAMERAAAWDPANPVYPATLANLIHLYGDNADPAEVIRLYQSAVNLSPFDAAYFADLAQAHEWTGHSPVALPLFQRAQKLFPNSPEINWKLANFYVRIGKESDAVAPLQKVMQSHAIANSQVFALTNAANFDTAAVIDELLPADPSAFFDYLNFQIDRSEIPAAQQTWDHLLQLRSPFTIEQTFHYLDALIKLRKVDRATKAWSALAARFPLQLSSPPSRDNLLTNGNLQADILNGGFDWRVNPATGVLVTQEDLNPSSHVRALRIDFNGSENLFYNSALQLVPVQPDMKYDFSAALRSERITTDSGVGLQITDAYGAGKIFAATDRLTGTTPWSHEKISFQTAPDTHLVVVSIVRTPSRKFDSKIAGTFWLSRVCLVPNPSATALANPGVASH